MKGFFVRLAIVAAALLAPSLGIAGETFRLLRLDGFAVKWGMPELGLPAQVSYAFVAAPISFPEAHNCKSMRPFAELARTAKPSVKALEQEVQAAFAAWQQAAAIEFRRSQDPQEADILIGVLAAPTGIAFSNVSYRQPTAPDVAVAQLRQALICFSPSKSWSVGFDGDLDTIDLRYAAMHEIGHAIGLNHPGPEGDVMSFKYLERFDQLQPGDRAGAAALYGVRLSTPATGAGVVKAVVRN